jgi:hypothetical protein
MLVSSTAASSREQTCATGEAREEQRDDGHHGADQQPRSMPPAT